MRIAIQGEEGSFHHQAAKKWFRKDANIVPADTFGGVFGALNHGDADAAVVAVENTLYGTINEVLDLVESYGYPVVGEVYLRVEQQLITLPGVKPEEITKIYSHPVALSQCEHYLDTHFPHANRIEHPDTAGSVEFIKQTGDPSFAAIAGVEAADVHNLPVLAANIEDNKANFTRFLVIKPNGKLPKNADKTSLVLTTDHTPGALARVLSTFGDSGINLAKLQSRPIIGAPWKYHFYIDVESSGDELHRIIDIAQMDGAEVTILGSYKNAQMSV